MRLKLVPSLWCTPTEQYWHRHNLRLNEAVTEVLVYSRFIEN